MCLWVFIDIITYDLFCQRSYAICFAPLFENGLWNLKVTLVINCFGSII